jgi:polyisoprenoid-binding protein YceI
MRTVTGWLAPLVLALSLPPAARAEPRPYKVARQRGETGIALEIPYSLGTHREKVLSVLGELLVEPEALTVTGGRLVVPISALRSDSAERDCHLRESLGLDYERSRFPEEHVCDDRDRLPASGGDAVVHPEVVFEVERGGAIDPAGGLEQGKEVRAAVEGRWSIHGVSRPARLELALSKAADAPGAIRARGRHQLSLRDHGVIVKSAKILFATISVRDEVTILLDVVVVPSGRASPSPRSPSRGRERPPCRRSRAARARRPGAGLGEPVGTTGDTGTRRSATGRHRTARSTCSSPA